MHLGSEGGMLEAHYQHWYLSDGLGPEFGDIEQLIHPPKRRPACEVLFFFLWKGSELIISGLALGIRKEPLKKRKKKERGGKGKKGKEKKERKKMLFSQDRWDTWRDWFEGNENTINPKKKNPKKKEICEGGWYQIIKSSNQRTTYLPAYLDLLRKSASSDKHAWRIKESGEHAYARMYEGAHT